MFRQGGQSGVRLGGESSLCECSLSTAGAKEQYNINIYVERSQYIEIAVSGNVKVAIDCHLSRKKISLRSRYNVGKHGKIEERVKMVDKCVQHECVQHECVGTKKEEQWPMMTFGERYIDKINYVYEVGIISYRSNDGLISRSSIEQQRVEKSKDMYNVCKRDNMIEEGKNWNDRENMRSIMMRDNVESKEVGQVGIEDKKSIRALFTTLNTSNHTYIYYTIVNKYNKKIYKIYNKLNNHCRKRSSNSVADISINHPQRKDYISESYYKPAYKKPSNTDRQLRKRRISWRSHVHELNAIETISIVNESYDHRSCVVYPYSGFVKLYNAARS